MKTVFTNSQCAHVWVQQTQEHGRGASVHFRGPLFYSYQTPVAAFVKNALGQTAALVSNESWSPTTGRHISHVQRALSGVPVYNVRRVHGGGWDRNELDHQKNVADLVADYHKEGERGMRRQEIADWNRNVIRNTYAHLADYARHFAVTLPGNLISPDSIIKQWSERQALLDASPARAARLAAQQARERIAEARRLEKLAKAPEIIAEWRAGERGNTLDCDLKRDADGGAMLRIVGDVVQTSLGAEVPIAHAHRVFRFWRFITDDGRMPWSRAERYNHVSHADTTLGHFTLDAIEENGDIKAGCHKVTRAELERFGKLLEDAT